MPINKNINHLRNLVKMSQRELGRKTDISPAAMSRYENGERELGSVDVAKIAKVFGVTVEMLMFEDLVSKFPSTEDFASWRKQEADRAAKAEQVLEALRMAPYRLDALMQHYAENVEKMGAGSAKNVLQEIETKAQKNAKDLKS